MENKQNVLITGASGNVGKAVIRFLNNRNSPANLFAGVRHIKKAEALFQKEYAARLREFDFEKPETFDNALKNIDLVFLLRPPHISDAKRVMGPLLEALKKHNIKNVVFLSVQGVEKSSVIPHHKIENLIREAQLNFVFLRPSYFMQNLTTTLVYDIKHNREIILPSGKAVFNWVDVENIGEVVAHVIDDFDNFQNTSMEITGYENKNFYEVAHLMTKVLQTSLTFKNVGPIRFFFIKKGQGMRVPMIIVMIMLHFLPRFQKPPEISNNYEIITGKKPTSLKEFIDNKRNEII